MDYYNYDCLNINYIKDTNLNIEKDLIDECPICYLDLSTNKKKLICGHIFHKKCIDKWTKINPICPYCRKILKTNFLFKLIKKKFSLKCKIIINEDTFSKIIIIYYYPFSNKIYKSYHIPTSYIKSVENNKSHCLLILKTSKKEEIKKYKYKFKNNDISIHFYEILKKIFQHNIST